MITSFLSNISCHNHKRKRRGSQRRIGFLGTNKLSQSSLPHVEPASDTFCMEEASPPDLTTSIIRSAKNRDSASLDNGNNSFQRKDSLQIQSNSVSELSESEFDEIHNSACASTSWTIHVLDDQTEQPKGEDHCLWFRIFFHRENDFVYYKNEEILDYVRDLVELNGRSVFHLHRMSTDSMSSVEANEVLYKLKQCIREAKQKEKIRAKEIVSKGKC